MSHLIQTDLRVSGSRAEEELGALLKLKKYDFFLESTIENASVCVLIYDDTNQTKPKLLF